MLYVHEEWLTFIAVAVCSWHRRPCPDPARLICEEKQISSTCLPKRRGKSSIFESLASDSRFMVIKIWKLSPSREQKKGSGMLAQESSARMTGDPRLESTSRQSRNSQCPRRLPSSSPLLSTNTQMTHVVCGSQRPSVREFPLLKWLLASCNWQLTWCRNKLRLGSWWLERARRIRLYRVISLFGNGWTSHRSWRLLLQTNLRCQRTLTRHWEGRSVHLIYLLHIHGLTKSLHSTESIDKPIHGYRCCVMTISLYLSMVHQ